MFFLFFLLCQGDPRLGTQFQNPSEHSDEYIGDPYSMHFSASGDLFIVDRYPSKIHQWKSDGSYLRTFGGKGEGPGELNRPLKITTTKDAVWVWDSSQRFSEFDLQGIFKRSFSLPGVEPRNFNCLPDGLVIAYKKYADSNQMRRYFQLLGLDGKPGKVIKDIRSNHLLAPLEGAFRGHLKAYAPESDIQKDPAGNLWIGFSESPVLYELNAKGEIVGEKRFALTTAKPTSEEREVFENLSFPNPRDGGRIALKDLPGMKWDYSHDKAFYSQFLMLSGKVLFVLTPLGSLNGGGHGFRSGSYTLWDFETGKPIKKGRFHYPEDSMLLLRDGRALTIIANDEAYQIREAHFE
jgi:WD40 repeat protein